jgi:hypothetical protein
MLSLLSMAVLTRMAVAAACVAAALAPSLARACGAGPIAYVTLAGALPAARTGVPRDGAVVVKGMLWGPGGGPLPFADVLLFDAAGYRIPAEPVIWYSGQPSLAYRWTVPPPPGSTITVEAVVPEGTARPAGADGPRTIRFSVETGDGFAPPLALAGPLRVRLEPFDADVRRCNGQNGCGPGPPCEKVGTRRALRAVVVVPAPTGGVDFDGYRGWLRFTDDQAATFEGAGEGRRDGPGNVNLMHWLEIRPGVETEVVQEIFDEETPYAPCFSLNLWDPAGHAIQADPVCLPAVTASEYVRTLDGIARDGSSGGCGVATANDGNAASLLVTCLAVASLRRKRIKR